MSAAPLRLLVVAVILLVAAVHVAGETERALRRRALAVAEAAEPQPCGTDLDCCERNPAICREERPDLYRAVWGKP